MECWGHINLLLMQANLLIVVEEVTKAMEERINGLDWLDAPKERALYILLDLTS